ncbi:hypothetical protein ACFXPS_44805, partial [Nocardia sp. NPDC059091]
GDIVDQLHRAIGSQLRASVPLTREWIQAYEDQYVAPEDRKTIHVSTGSLADANEIIRPNAMQEEALEEIAKVRTAGEKKALVVSATGT